MTTTTKLITLNPTVKISTTISTPPTPSTQTNQLPTVIFLHFWGGSSRTWSLVNPIILSKGYPTLALDFRGWGESTGPDAADAYSISTLADDLEAVIAQLLSQRDSSGGVVLIGLSMGAKVAQLLAARARGSLKSQLKLRGLVLISPAPATPVTLPPAMREQQVHAYETEESASFVARNVLTVSFRDSQPDGGKVLPGFVVEDMLRGNKYARRAWPAYGMAEDVSADVGGISVPVLVVAAEEDVVEPVERVRDEVCDRIPGSRLVVLKGSGHLSPLDRPDGVAGSLLKFLGGL